MRSKALPELLVSVLETLLARSVQLLPLTCRHVCSDCRYCTGEPTARVFYALSKQRWFVPTIRTGFCMQLVRDWESAFVRLQTPFRGLTDYYNDMTSSLFQHMYQWQPADMRAQRWALSRETMAEAYYRYIICVHLERRGVLEATRQGK